MSQYLSKVTDDNGAVNLWAGAWFACKLGHQVAQHYNAMYLSPRNSSYYLQYDCNARAFFKYPAWDASADDLGDGVDTGSVGSLNSLTSLNTTTTTPSGCDYDGSGSLDSVDMNELIDYLFQGGSLSFGTTGDVNADGQADANDLNAFINHLYFNYPMPAGCQATQQSQPPVIQYLLGSSVLFDGDSGKWEGYAINPESDPITYTFNWGDGSSPTVISNITHKGFVWGYHTYPGPGAYTVSLRAQDSQSSDYRFKSVLIQPALTSIASSSIIVITPNGGEVWNIGSTYIVDWDYYGSVSPNTRQVINLLKNGSEILEIANLMSAEDSVTSWTIPAGTNNTWLNEGDNTYQVKAMLIDTINGILLSHDVSDNYFTILPATSTSNQPPVINSFTGPTTVIAGESNTWYGRATDPGSSYVNWEVIWEGGASASTGTVPSGATISFTHAYPTDTSLTSYPIGVSVNDGFSSTAINYPITILPATSTSNEPPIITEFNFTSPAQEDVAVSVSRKAYDPEGSKLFGYLDWGNSSSLESFSNIPSGGSLVSSHIYYNPGTYYFTYVVRDILGAETVQAKPIVILSATTTTPISPAPILQSPTITPKTITSTALPLGASVIDALQSQLDVIKTQLQAILLKL